MGRVWGGSRPLIFGAPKGVLEDFASWITGVGPSAEVEVVSAVKSTSFFPTSLFVGGTNFLCSYIFVAGGSVLLRKKVFLLQ